MSSEDALRAERLKKLGALKAAGQEPYPARTRRTHTIAKFLAQFKNLTDKETVLAGRVMSLRGQGGILFSDLFDGTGRVQAVLQKSDTAELELFEQTVDLGDFVEVVGTAFTTQRGTQSLKAASWRMLAKSLAPLPTEHFGIKDEELRLRRRYLDLLLNPQLRAMVERRAKFWSAVRGFLVSHGFLEVETPALETSPGGADARPFVTHHNALDIDVYLRISAGELWQKKLLIAGFPKVFEIGRIFRNEGQSSEHLQDYTQMEFYEAYADYHKGMELVRDLVCHVASEVYGTQQFTIRGHEVDLAKEWEVLDFSNLMQKEFGLDPANLSAAEAHELDQKWKQLRKTISGPAFLTGAPLFMSPLAKAGEAGTAERFQVLIAGSEVGNGYSEQNDPQEQEARFKEQQALRDAGDEEAQRLDREYIEAMSFGMPPALGFGFSERLFAFFEDKPVHETQLFPLLRPKQE